jgi:2-succinyl-6-hydroxy-2,4-cyclohexadiene-1-carboxylate synthase
MSPPLYTLHGFTGRADAWDHVAPHAAGRLSLIGHAPDLPVPHGWSFELEVDRIAQLLAGPGPVHLAGYSMGGRVALAVAARHPERIARLTLVSAQPGLTHAAAAADRRMADEHWCELLENAGIAAFVAAWEDLPMWRSQGRLAAELRDRQRRARLEHSPHALAAALRALGSGAMPSLWDRLPELPMAIEWVAGGADERYAELAQRAAALSPHAKVIIIPGAGHNVLLEAPDNLSRELFGARGERRAI